MSLECDLGWLELRIRDIEKWQDKAEVATSFQALDIVVGWSFLMAGSLIGYGLFH